MPGIYVVTSTALVKSTRATLRSAEFGFFGVWVYTRMHTPRFSGQPISAGDLVLERTASLPIRTSCEKVRTVVPLFKFPVISSKSYVRVERFLTHYLRLTTKNFLARIHILPALALRADKFARAHTNAERYCESGENQQETPYALQETELSSRYRIGEAYSAFR